MAAYVVARVRVTDPERYASYKLLTPAAIAKYEGRFVARGGETEVLEGPDEDRRIVLLEFPSMAKAREFYDSPEYRQARDARAAAAEMEMLVISGD